ncbi:MAG: accessory gene regulator B family protein [Clostridia bacterium]|nr:accessory gene regulator B family protein [Clostridia bacterium]
MNRLAEQAAARLAKWTNHKNAQALYAYVLNCLFSSLCVHCTVIAICAVIGCLSTVLVWYAFFIPLRRLTGGLHFASPAPCFVLSTVVPVLCALLAQPLAAVRFIPVLELTAAAAALLIVSGCAPVIHPNHPVPSRLRPKYKRIACLVACAEFFILPALQYSDPVYAAAATLGTLAASISTLTGYVIERAQHRIPSEASSADSNASQSQP